MSTEERKRLWKQRIDAFQASGDSNVKAWCHRNQIGLQSMYKWMKRFSLESRNDAESTTQWMSLGKAGSLSDLNESLRIHIGNVSIEIREDFNRALFQEVLEILQSHVK